jgi:hypothetical protein
MDDLITRLRTLMAEVEARIRHGEILGDEDISPKLQEALRLPQIGAETRADPKPHSDPPTSSKTYGPGMADRISATPARDIKLDDYVPRSHTHEGFDPEDFIGSGDSDPLGHEELIRR